MSRAAVGSTIHHHQSLFGYGWLHARWLAHYSHINLGQQLKGALASVLPRHLLLGRGEIHHIIFTLARVEDVECLKQRHQSAAAVVAAEPVEPVVGNPRAKRVASPGCRGLHRVYVCVEQQSGLALVKVVR